MLIAIKNSLDQYVYGSAEVVGLMCLKIFVEGNQDLYDKLKDSAKKLGSAFQKVNFFRDIREDYFEKGRIYFPGFDLDQNLNDEIKSIEIETPEISNQIAKLNQDIENFADIKADLAMATAKKLGINVDEKTLKSVEVIEGKVVISLEGSSLVSVVDKNMLINDADKFIDSTSKLSINSKGPSSFSFTSVK